MTSLPKSAKFAPKKHIAFISYYFPPMGGGGVQRVVKFLKFADLQHTDISVITVKPSYFYASDPTLLADLPQGISIHKSGSLDPFRIAFLLKSKLLPPRTDSDSPAKESGEWLRKISGQIFVPDSRLLWLPFAFHKLRQCHQRKPFDMIIATMPPFTAGLIGAYTSQKLGIPLILDYRDGWSINPYLPQMGKFQSKLSLKMERYCLKHSRGVVFVNPVLAEEYAERFPEIRGVPTTVIRNGFDPDDYSALPAAAPANSGRFELGVFGSVYSQGNSPETLLIALQRLKAKNPDALINFRLTFLGKWTAAFPEMIRDMGLTDIVHLKNYLPHQEALARAAQFDALAIMVDSRMPGSRALTPGRIYEYLALRRPVLALCPVDGDVASLIRQANAGKVIPFDDIDAIAATLIDWTSRRDHFSKEFQFLNIDQFNRERQAVAFWQFINRCVKK